MTSFLQLSDAINSSDIQIWNNAAFDDGLDPDDLKKSSSSWLSQPSLDSSCTKENLSPVFENASVPVKSSIHTKPLHLNTSITNTPLKVASKKVLVSKIPLREDEKVRDDMKRIDLEIEVIEKEISRLLSRLEALRLEKAERSVKSAVEKRGRMVPAKFMEQKQSVKIEESMISNEKSKVDNRRGVSLGPAEIYSGSKTRFLTKPETTPGAASKNRRLSCYWKLGEIDELRVLKERGKSLSVSPRSRKSVSKIQCPKQAVTSVGSKRPVKKDEGVLATIQPKTLFKEGEKPVPGKKLPRPGQVIASRYHQVSTNGSVSEARKRSFPDDDKEDGNKRRASRCNVMTGQKTDGARVKKKWNIPNEVVVYKGSDAAAETESPPSVSTIVDVLPKIKTSRCLAETPRDSGAAKRVADLVGKKSYFSVEEKDAAGDSLVQTLSFVEEEDDQLQ